MLFALHDYIQYRRRAGRYGDDTSANIMAHGFVGKIPPETVSMFEEGDTALTQRLNSFFSWGLMYFGSSPADHIAVHVGGGNVLHMTLSGSKVHHISVFSRHTRVLVFRLDASGFKRREDMTPAEIAEVERERPRQPSHMLPPKLQLVWAGLRVMFGLHPDRYRWKFFADLAIVFAIAYGALLPWVNAWPIFLVPAWALLFAFYQGFRAKWVKDIEPMNVPGDMLLHLIAHGGIVFTRYGTLMRRGRVSPESVLGSHGERT